MLSIGFFGAGVVALIASIWAWRKNRRIPASEVPPRWRWLWRWWWTIGLLLGVASFFMRYTLDDGAKSYLVHGVPFVAYVFDSKGHGYSGPLTLPTMALNFVVWGLLPQLILWGLVRHSPKR